MTEASSGMTVSSVIVEVLSRYPSREAFVAGDRRLTYAKCSEIVGRLMAAYAARGVGAGSSVAMLSPNRPESWLAAAATTKVLRLAGTVALGVAVYFGMLWVLGFRLGDFMRRAA